MARSKDTQQAMKSLVLDQAKHVITNKLRETLPYNLGNVLLNQNDKVKVCGDITSQYLCQHSMELFNLECQGWGGSCLEGGVTCSSITVPDICNKAKAKLGIDCLGWGGSSCL